MVLLLFAVLLVLLYNFPLHHATKKSRRAKSRREGGQLMGIIQTRSCQTCSKQACLGYLAQIIYIAFIIQVVQAI